MQLVESNYESLLDDFLEELSNTGLPRKAALAIGVPYRYIVDKRSQDSDFDSQVQDMVELFNESLEQEAYERAMRGEATPIYNKGEHVDTIYRKSDTLLIKVLQANMPDKYGNKQQITGDANAPLRIVLNNFDEEPQENQPLSVNEQDKLEPAPEVDVTELF